MGRSRRLSFVIAILVAAAASTSVAAQAVPGDPQPGCESDFWGTMYCDGPIREDGTWKRCRTWRPSYVPGGSYIPGGTKCDIIDQGSIPFGTPDHHIEE